MVTHLVKLDWAAQKGGSAIAGLQLAGQSSGHLTKECWGSSHLGACAVWP